MKVLKSDEQPKPRTVDLRKRIQMIQIRDGEIRNVGVLVAEAGLKSGLYKPYDPDKPAKKEEGKGK